MVGCIEKVGGILVYHPPMLLLYLGLKSVTLVECRLVMKSHFNR